MTEIEDIPSLPDREQRMDALMVDTYGLDEELGAFDVYLSDCLVFPFVATWEDEMTGRSGEVTVLSMAESESDEQGLLFTVRHENGRTGTLPAYQVTPTAEGRNAVVLADYRDWFDPNDWGDFDAY